MGCASFLGAVDHHLGTLDAALGRTDTAADELEAGLERHRASGARPFVALSARWLANVLSERDAPGDVDRALLLHAESVAIEEELGLASLPPSHPSWAGTSGRSTIGLSARRPDAGAGQRL